MLDSHLSLGSGAAGSWSKTIFFPLQLFSLLILWPSPIRMRFCSALTNFRVFVCFAVEETMSALCRFYVAKFLNTLISRWEGLCVCDRRYRTCFRINNSRQIYKIKKNKVKMFWHGWILNWMNLDWIFAARIYPSGLKQWHYSAFNEQLMTLQRTWSSWAKMKTIILTLCLLQTSWRLKHDPYFTDGTYCTCTQPHVRADGMINTTYEHGSWLSACVPE